MASSGLQGGTKSANHQQEPSWRARCGDCGARRIDAQLGLEATPEAYLEAMVGVFREVRRVLRDDGTLWMNMGDSYLAQPGAGYPGYGGRNVPADPAVARLCKRPAWLKPKDLVGMPWRLAFALQADGWFLRADIIWAKPNPMPESVTDRPTKSHEYVFLLSKKASYYYDADAVREPSRSPVGAPVTGNYQSRAVPADVSKFKTMNGWTVPERRNLRSVWTINPEPFPEAHFATFPTALASRCIQAGTSERGCCAACGAPWERLVARETQPQAYDARKYAADPILHRTKRNLGARYQVQLDEHPLVTTGWAATCACDAGSSVPCTVLDPFGGSGTVGMVAEQLGRHSILIELSPAYGEMARRRTAQLGLFTQTQA